MISYSQQKETALGVELFCFRRWITIFFVGSFLAACASGEPPSISTWDSHPAALEAGADLFPPLFDIYSLPHDLYREHTNQGGDACIMGTPDNCSHCGHSCPPDQDTASTTRTCQAGKCDFQCEQEAYDVNGDTGDGCEAMDDLPLHDTKDLAIDLGTFSDCSSDQNTTGVIPSDDRTHRIPPSTRSNGRADWYRLTIDDDPGCVTEGRATVSLAGLPSDALYRVVAFYICVNGDEMASDARQGNGGEDLYLIPSLGCTTGGLGDDSGTLFIKIVKEAGNHSTASYSLTITP